MARDMYQIKSRLRNTNKLAPPGRAKLSSNSFPKTDAPDSEDTSEMMLFVSSTVIGNLHRSVSSGRDSIRVDSSNRMLLVIVMYS